MIHYTTVPNSYDLALIILNNIIVQKLPYNIFKKICKAIIRFGANNSLDIVHTRQSSRHFMI